MKMKAFITIAILICGFCVGFSFGGAKPQVYAPETQVIRDSAKFYKADRDEQIERRIVAEHQNAQLKQQLQQYQAAVEKINDRLKKAKDITPPAANTNAPTVSTNQAAANK